MFQLVGCGTKHIIFLLTKLMVFLFGSCLHLPFTAGKIFIFVLLISRTAQWPTMKFGPL